MMSNERNPDGGRETVYQIRLGGHLGREWTDGCEGSSLTLEEGGTTLLTLPGIDQAALFGVLRRVRDLGLPLISVTRVTSDSPDPPGIGNTWL